MVQWVSPTPPPPLPQLLPLFVYNLSRRAMVYVKYFQRGFNFFDIRFSQDGDNFVISNNDTRKIVIPSKDMGTFMDLLKECIQMYIDTNTKRVMYGTLMCLYEDEGGVVIWYNKQSLVVKRIYLRQTFIVLKKIVKKWLLYCKYIEDGDYKDGDDFYLNA